MMYKARQSVANWRGIFSSEDVKRQMERSNGIIDKINELFDLWIDREKRRKGN